MQSIDIKFFKFAVVLVPLILCSCSSGTVKKSLGLDKGAPDEFMVIARPPLSVPPEFTLAPPADSSIQSTSKTREQAKDVLFPNAKTSSENITRGEVSLLKQANSSLANPKIREILAQEQAAAEKVEEEENVLDKLRSTLNPEEEPTVNIDKEEERLQKNAEEGKAVNDGEIPTNDPPKSKGILNGLINN